MINWGAFLLVALVSLVSAGALVTIYASGLRLLAVDGRPRAAVVGAYACFTVCALGVLFGIYLIVPALHAS
ncbi:MULTISPECIES: hypothetical protein [unclassified Frondihabitans]|uniref:hypothetical protein n=1 Tax=unclassified Frondihabitans TaxID=2626248 RepID=UPI000701B4C4|nr:MULTISPECIES: hypothetical protein [unclassified Frondihabitans]KQQ26493.1 hypothetical protein ASF54_10685 [Frondihabitans sp. Leaf304]MBF4576790.1 hypothetical protein [Frondihabitans sp. VKM Ac-2883]RPE76563.1 hypothetical protein EDF37_2391 [Frondihabitans sp. PhB153]RPF05162.1 hypothetical protein EDF39_1858 [Frondihabitans sp. PhB161]